MNIISNLAIILCTYNSAKFLTEQLMSFDAQNFSDWSLSSVLYRQHDHNLIGSNSGFKARLIRKNYAMALLESGTIRTLKR